MNWNKFLPCILLTTVLGACSGKGEQTNVEPAALCLTDSLLRIVSVYRHGAEWLEELIQVIKGNYEYVRDFFAQHFPGVVVTELEGTYLVWCDFRCFGMSDADMKVFLTDECMLYLDNGTDFGAAGSGYQRINVACPRKTLADALDRFYQAAKKRGMAR